LALPTENDSQPEVFVRLGGWLFRQRTWIPLPIALALVVVAPGKTLPTAYQWVAGAALVAAGESIRLWSVRHIGVISRTRSDRLGPLVASGPFALVRNPLYIGNILLWTGFAVTVGVWWLTVAIVVVLGAEYHAIVRWEEQLLLARMGDAYRAYARQIPRWIPGSTRQPARPDPLFSWRATFFSERGTFIAIAIGYLLLWSKARF